MGSERRSAQAGCSGCGHYFITHQPAWPHGCRAFGFVSSGPPSAAVQAWSGRECQLREPRSAAGGEIGDSSRPRGGPIQAQG